MTSVCLLLALLAPWAAALLSTFQSESRAARRIGLGGNVIGLSAAIGAALLGGGVDPAGASAPLLAALVPSQGWALPLPAFVHAIGLVAVGLTPAMGASPATFARILLLTGLSVATVLTRAPLLLSVLLCASVIPVWLELRARPKTSGTARLLSAYMLPSCSLLVAGVLFRARGLELYALLALAGGVAIREAFVPFHTWYPRFVERAPMGIVVAFAAPQLGVYAHLRMLSGGLPQELASALAAVGVVTVLFAAAMGAVQNRARRALGYLMMSQTALVAFGLETESLLGRTGALCTWLVCGLSMAGLAMATEALEARRGVLDLEHPNGSFRRTPMLATAYLLLGLSSVGLPGTFGFVAEDLLVQGSVETYPLLGLALIVGTALNSVTVLRGFFGLFTGSRKHTGERDLTPRERAVLTAILAALVVTGLWPDVVLGKVGSSHGRGAEVHEQQTNG